jgi:hypothetical protein
LQENFEAAIRSVLAAIASTIALTGCAPSSSPTLPDPALLRPQPAPDCEFGRSHRKTLDAEQ